MNYLGDHAEDQSVYFMWSSSDGDGASITRATDGTISVYKDNSDGSSFDQTQVTTGVTNDEDVDGLTGVHSCCITTTDAWYETGHDYVVVLSAATIDGNTVNAPLAHFSIENRFDEVTVTSMGAGVVTAAAIADAAIDNATFAADVGSTAYATNVIALAVRKVLDEIHLDHLLAVAYDPASKPGAADALLNEIVENDGGVSRFTENALEQAPSGTGGDATEAKQDQLIAAVITNAAGTDIAADIIAVKAETANIVEDTGTTLPGLLSTAQSDLDTITGADGATLATLQGNYAPNKVVPDAAGVAPTAAEIKTAIEAPGGHLALILEDTDELQTNQGDWVTATGFATSVELAKVPKSDGTVSWNATAAAQIQSEATDALNAYDPPTRAELTTDKDSIITQVNANETKIDTMQGNVTDILADTGTTLDGKLDDLLQALVYKLIINENGADAGNAGDAEFHNSAGVSQGTVLSCFTSDGDYTTRKKCIP